MTSNDQQKHYIENYRSSKTNPTENGGELRFSGRVGSSCSTCGTRRVNLVANPMISHEPGHGRIVITIISVVIATFNFKFN